MNYEQLVSGISRRLQLHHQIYSGKCKGELWEEVCAGALIDAGLGSDWSSDFNHKTGVDQTTSCGIAISNKSGKMNSECSAMTISGSRTTKHKTLEEKLSFLGDKTEDFIFCLATAEKDWNNGRKIYHFVVVDSHKLDYKNARWSETHGTRTHNCNDVVGYKFHGDGFHGLISKSMSDQVWTTISALKFEYTHKIVIE